MSNINEINNILSSIQMDRKDKAKLARKLSASNVEIVYINAYETTFEELLKYKDRYINGEIIFKEIYDEYILTIYYAEDCIYINAIAPFIPVNIFSIVYLNTGEIFAYDSIINNDCVIYVDEADDNILLTHINVSLHALKLYSDGDIGILADTNFILDIYNGTTNQKLNCSSEINYEYNTITLRASNDKYFEIRIIIDFNIEDIYVENVVLRTVSENQLPYLILQSGVRYYGATYQALLNIIKNGGIVQIKFGTTSIDTVIEITNYTFDSGKIYLYTLNGKYEFENISNDEYWITKVTE